MKARNRKTGEGGKVRYGVAGLGWFAQVAILPAFRHASRNSRLTALFSDDPVKLEKLGKKYGAPHLHSYDEFDEALRAGIVDAVYIALPNDLHREYTERAARAGVHVLCEKPMAVTSRDCRAMIHAAERARVKLMIAYRLHFDRGNLEAVEIVNSGKLGEPRIYNSVFANRVEDEKNIRLNPLSQGGGTLYDIGIYCLNAARYLFRSEPVPRGEKDKYTDKQKRQAEHIEKGYESRGVPEQEAERRAWATVNKVHHGGEKPGGGGYGKPEDHEPMRKGGREGGRR